MRCVRCSLCIFHGHTGVTDFAQPGTQSSTQVYCKHNKLAVNFRSYCFLKVTKTQQAIEASNVYIVLHYYCVLLIGHYYKITMSNFCFERASLKMVYG